MRRWKWKRGIVVLFLMGGLIFQAGQEGFCADGAGWEKTEGTGQDETGEGTQGVSDGGSSFVIDSQNIYEGMEKSWSRGYVPKVEKKKAVVVLPLQAKRKLSGNQVTASVSFGESERLPFVQKNYEKIVSYSYHKTGKGGALAGCWLVSFDLELKEERYNGSYPVMVSVCAEDEEANELRQEFTVYVTITDGVEGQGMSDGGNTSGLFIDNRRVYQGMEKSYARGYVPKIEKDRVIIVLPLRAKHKLSKNQMTVSVSFGESEHLPFVRKNYEKTVFYGRHKTGKAGKKIGGYLVTFSVKLKKGRYNGNYPVTLSVCAEDRVGNELRQEFTVYVTIADGKKAGAEKEDGDGENQPRFLPKVMIDTCQLAPEKILCGEKFTAKLILRNTSRTESVKNMLVTVLPDENVELCGKTNSAYREELTGGGTCDVSFAFCVKAAAPGGQYTVEVTMDYEDGKGTPHTRQEIIKISAEQRTRIEIAPHSVPGEIQLGETVGLQAQVMNLGKGKLYNVRVQMEADGLAPLGVAFIGDIEPGTSVTGEMEFTAEGFSEDSLYGITQGKIIFYYEDEAGTEMTQEQSFETSIVSPLRGEKEEKEPDDTRQWWVIMAGITMFLILTAAVFFVRRSGQKKTGEIEEDEK